MGILFYIQLALFQVVFGGGTTINGGVTVPASVEALAACDTLTPAAWLAADIPVDLYGEAADDENGWCRSSSQNPQAEARP